MNNSWDDNSIGGVFHGDASALDQAEHGEDIATYAAKHVHEKIEKGLRANLAGSGLSVEYYSHEGGPVEIFDGQESALVQVSYDHEGGTIMFLNRNEDGITYGDSKQVAYNDGPGADEIVEHVTRSLGIEPRQPEVAQSNTCG